MNKAFTVILIALMASSIAFALDAKTPGINISGAATFKTPIDPSLIIPEGERSEKPLVRNLFLSGQGSAVAELDKSDIQKIRLVAGQVDLPNGNIQGHGLIWLNQTKYRLIHVTVDDQKTVRADLVPTTDMDFENPNYVGAIQLVSSTKNNRDLWTGTLTFNAKKYNMFLFASKRSYKPAEIPYQTGIYCKANPTSADCKSVSGIDCSGDAKDCRLRVIQYCASHAADARCTSLLTNHCTETSYKDYRCQELQRVGASGIAVNR